MIYSKCNINPETRIHYGVCNGNSQLLPNDWFDGFEPYHDDDNDIDIETETYVCNSDTLKAEYNSNTNIIMIYYSSNVVRCRYCSPCFPNAGDLDSLDDAGVKTYGFPIQQQMGVIKMLSTVDDDPKKSSGNNMYRKINIFVGNKYVCSTTQAKTLEEAKQKFIDDPSCMGIGCFKYTATIHNSVSVHAEFDEEYTHEK